LIVLQNAVDSRPTQINININNTINYNTGQQTILTNHPPTTSNCLNIANNHDRQLEQDPTNNEQSDSSQTDTEETNDGDQFNSSKTNESEFADEH
jgi:hypothetical protein